ncbi:hypothetical protein WKK05_38025 (plasmid) [Nostoc sp. UHCC 0302]|uniref:hypothetical protein n=1 Tax=Nostoc sp. UHCC 0302 TaxID=3134896 RepID=UPI00311CA9E0
MTKTGLRQTIPKSVIVELSATPEKFLENGLKAPQPHSQGCLYPYLEKKKLLNETEVDYQVPPSIALVEVTFSATPEKFLENGLRASQFHSQGCLYPYLEKKKLLDGTIAFYPRVIGQRNPDNAAHYRWGKINSQFAIRSYCLPQCECNAKS